MTQDELTAAVTALREAESKMTPGEWIGGVLPWDVTTDDDGPIAQVEAANPLWTYDKDGIVALRNTALPVIDALTKRAERLRKYDPLETGCQWEDADDIAHAVHRACVAIMEGKTPAQEPTNG